MKHIHFIFSLVLCLFCTEFVFARPALVGHRGSIWGVESSKTAFIRGAQAGFAGLETDVKVTKDKKFVLIHDDNLSRFGQSESVTIAGSTLAELKALKLTQKRYGVTYTDTICTLEEYLDICKQYDVFPLIELKWATGINNNDQSNMPAMLKVIADKGMTDKAVILTSMKPCLEFIRNKSAYPDMQLQFLCYPATAATSLAWCTTNKLDVDIQTGFTVDVVENYHAAGLKVNCWTINTPSNYESYEIMGVDMVTTDSLKPSELLPEQTVFVDLLWEKKQAESGYLVSGNKQCSMAFHNKKLYIPNNADASIAVVDANDGSLLKTLQPATDAWLANSVTFTANGALLLGNTGKTDSVFYIYTCDTVTGTATLLAQMDVKGLGVADYMDVYGNLYSDVGGYIVSAGSTGNVALFRMSSGKITFERLLEGCAKANVQSVQTVVKDEKSFFVIGKGMPRTLCYLDGSSAQTFGSEAPATTTASGACFTYGGYCYYASGEAISGITQLFDITEGVANAKEVGDATASFGRISNTLATTPICIEVKSDKVILYVMATNGGIAAYSCKLPKMETGVKNAIGEKPVFRTTSEGVSVIFEGKAEVAVYTMNGLLVDKTIAYNEYNQLLKKGMYIICIDNQAYKFLK